MRIKNDRNLRQAIVRVLRAKSYGCLTQIRPVVACALRTDSTFLSEPWTFEAINKPTEEL